jgi:hypothetical protein
MAPQLKGLVGIRVDVASSRGSLYDVMLAVTGCVHVELHRNLTRLVVLYPVFGPDGGRVDKIRINGKGHLTPVADAFTLIEIAYLLPGRIAAAYRRSSADMVRRMLGGDMSIIDEIEQRHANLQGTTAEGFLLGTVSTASLETNIPGGSIIWDRKVYDEIVLTLEECLIGSVYIATAPGLNVVKIGSWKENMGALRSRYVTYYGQKTCVWAYATEDCKESERQCHDILEAHRLSNELYDPDQLAHYVDVVAGVCGWDCLMCP